MWQVIVQIQITRKRTKSSHKKEAVMLQKNLWIKNAFNTTFWFLIVFVLFVDKYF